MKTNTTKIPILVLQKLSLLDSSFIDCFIRKIATICSIPWFSTYYISKSSTRWHVLLFIVSFVLPYSTQKCRFHKIDMDFEIVASTLNIRQTITTMSRFCLNIWILNLNRYNLYISKIFNSFVRRLLGNEKGYQLRLCSRLYYQFSNQRNNFH